MTDRVRMVNSRGTLESLRHIGITLEEGITELVDNAVDAGATEIQLTFFPERGTRQATLLVADNGVGIPEAVPGSEVVNTVQHVCIRWKIPHHGRPIPIGSTALDCPKRPQACRFAPASPPRWRVASGAPALRS